VCASHVLSPSASHTKRERVVSYTKYRALKRRVEALEACVRDC